MGDENEVSSAFDGPGAMNATVGHWVAMASMVRRCLSPGSAARPLILEFDPSPPIGKRGGEVPMAFIS